MFILVVSEPVFNVVWPCPYWQLRNMSSACQTKDELNTVEFDWARNAGRTKLKMRKTFRLRF